MNLILHHLSDGTFAAEVPTETGEPEIVFSSPYDSNAGRESQYQILAAVLLRLYGLILPSFAETNLDEPGEESVPVKIAG